MSSNPLPPTQKGREPLFATTLRLLAIAGVISVAGLAIGSSPTNTSGILAILAFAFGIVGIIWRVPFKHAMLFAAALACLFVGISTLTTGQGVMRDILFPVLSGLALGALSWSRLSRAADLGDTPEALEHRMIGCLLLGGAILTPIILFFS